MKYRYVFLLLLFILSIADAKESDDDSGQQPPAIGNFALPASQQPGPLISFGQNIIGANVLQFFLAPDDFVGANSQEVDILPIILYGVTDQFSIAYSMPVEAYDRIGQQHASGLEDAILQFEYAVYANSTFDHTDQITIVSNVTFPTGSSTKQPNTGLGSPSFFIGATLNRMYVKWFYFASDGVMLTTSNDDTRFGNQVWYQAGIGRNLFDIDTRWLFDWLVEADGVYTQENRINGAIDPNSGGNIVYVTPSIYIASQKLIFQFGAGVPITQHWNGNQGNEHYLLILSLGWTF